jgi:hypothetical protein
MPTHDPNPKQPSKVTKKRAYGMFTDIAHAMTADKTMDELRAQMK